MTKKTDKRKKDSNPLEIPRPTPIPIIQVREFEKEKNEAIKKVSKTSLKVMTKLMREE